MLEAYLFPLQRSKNASDKKLYAEATGSFAYFRERLGLQPFKSAQKKINNWQFLQLLAFCWKELNIAQNDTATSKDLARRLDIENIGVRVMSKYHVCYTNLFSGQTNYAIYGFNPVLLTSTLEDVLLSNGQLLNDRKG